MSKIEKLINKVFSASEISYQDAEKILFRLGYDLEVSGSHHVFRKPGYGHISIKRRSGLYSYQISELRDILVKHGYPEEKI